MTACGVSAEELAAVEVVGGGSPIPMVQVAIEAATKEGLLSRTLDPASAVAAGAALLSQGAWLGETAPAAVETGALRSDEQIAAWQQAEQAMAEGDAAIEKLENARNELESFVFETRAAAEHSKHKALFNKDGVLPLLEQAQTWLEEDEGGSVLESVVAKLKEVKQSVQAENKVGFCFFLLICLAVVDPPLFFASSKLNVAGV